MSINLYDILEVPHDASRKEIRDAYKRLSLCWHPDKNKDDKNAEQKYKEIMAAYKILSDDTARKKYDEHKITTDTELCIDPFEAIKSSFEGDAIPNIVIYLELATKDLYFETERTVNFDRYSLCVICNGTGTEDGTLKTCETCKGTGSIMETIKGGVLGYMINQKQCKICEGSGIPVDTNLCKTCEGLKYVKETVIRTIKVPAGAYTNYRIVIENEGNYVPENERDIHNNKSRSDVVIVIKEIASRYKRGVYIDKLKRLDMSDLMLEIEIEYTEAINGYVAKFEHVNGKDISIVIDELIQNYDIYVIKDQGMPSIKNNSKGNLFIKFKVKHNQEITKTQRRRIYQILANKSYIDTPACNNAEISIHLDKWIEQVRDADV